MTTLPVSNLAPTAGRHGRDRSPRDPAATAPGRPRPGRPPGRRRRLGEQAFRAGQLSRHYFGRLVRDPAAMTDLPAATRERITAALLPTLLTPVRELACDGGATRKTLWRLHDGALVESVLMGYPDRVTVCVSSQAGCGMGCPFCATGQAGLTRNLSTAEIVDQVVWFAGWPPAGLPGLAGAAVARRVHGHGRAARQLRPGARGGPPARRARRRKGSGCPSATSPSPPSGWCRRCAGWPMRISPVTLALSLHAPDDDLRDELVPVNQRWKVAEVLDAAWDVRGSHGPARVHRVRDDPGRERPAVAGGPAGPAAGRPAGACQPDPAQPDAG